SNCQPRRLLPADDEPSPAIGHGAAGCTRDVDIGSSGLQQFIEGGLRWREAILCVSTGPGFCRAASPKRRIAGGRHSRNASLVRSPAALIVKRRSQATGLLGLLGGFWTRASYATKTLAGLLGGQPRELEVVWSG